MSLAGIDLNLLVVLRALADERSVTKAARRLRVTQSAVSNALARLRVTFGDELYVRAASGMVPTARAESLEPLVRRALGDVELALRPAEAFDPARSDVVFTLAMIDYAELLLLPELALTLARVAPRVRLRVHALGTTLPANELESGALSMTIGFRAEPLPRLTQQVLYVDRMACVLRRDHPALRGADTLSLDAYCALPHLLVSLHGGTMGMVDHELSKLGRRRDVALTIPRFSGGAALVARGDYVLTVPERVARYFARIEPLVVLTPPLELPSVRLTQVWHVRSDDDPAHQWLRKLVATLASSDVPRRKPKERR